VLSHPAIFFQEDKGDFVFGARDPVGRFSTSFQGWDSLGWQATKIGGSRICLALRRKTARRSGGVLEILDDPPFRACAPLRLPKVNLDTFRQN
jgi:hypothetical protein